MALTMARVVSVSITNPLFHDEAASSHGCSWRVGKENKPGIPGRDTRASRLLRLLDPMPITGSSRLGYPNIVQAACRAEAVEI
jgi:hypothetical protein